MTPEPEPPVEEEDDLEKLKLLEPVPVPRRRRTKVVEEEKQPANSGDVFSVIIKQLRDYTTNAIKENNSKLNSSWDQKLQDELDPIHYKLNG